VLDKISTTLWKESFTHVNVGDMADFVKHCKWVCKVSSNRKRKTIAQSEYAARSRERLTADRMVVYPKTVTGCTAGCPDLPSEQYCVSHLNLASCWYDAAAADATPIKNNTVKEALMRKLLEPDHLAIMCQLGKCVRSGRAAGMTKEAKDITRLNLSSLLVLAAEEEACLTFLEKMPLGPAIYE
jgi:hypothetical protein